MAEDVFAVPDLTKKVRYRREREQETEDRGEREERVVDIYDSADDLYPGPDPDPDLGLGPNPDTDTDTQQDAVQQYTTKQQHGASDESWKKNAFKAATVCLGVLCVILLAGITGLGVHNSKLIKENHNLTKLKDQCQSRCNNVTAERDEQKRRLCGAGWQGSGRGCYYISTARKTWEESRKYCRARQSDLIIINSKDEQDFVNRNVNRDPRVWLGLTDMEKEGVWKWVDGTPLTSQKYWNRGEPNNYGGGEDCAEHRGYWFDQPCTETKRWICEKVL